MAGQIPPNVIEQIRNASDIVDVIGGFIPLKRAGANFVALCPFHREKSPSFNVNPSRQIFHCFGCHKGGDVFTFVREYENLTFFESVKRLADRANIVLEFEQNPEYQQTRQLKDTLLTVHEHLTQRWHACLLNDPQAAPAREYLKSRAVDPEAVNLFRLGFAPDAWDDTVNWARAKRFELAAVEQAGLILKREGGEGYYDRFRGRLIFPICDEQGRVIGFSGRVLDAEAKTAKYVNSPETPLFTKGRVFFGLDKSKRAVLDAQKVIVCEGQLDLIRCFTNDVKNVVAPQGTALTQDQARILKRYADEVTLCFDADEAGRKAAERSFESLAEQGLAVRVANVPPPHDPDSFIREHGGAAFQKLIDAAPGYFDFLLDRLCTEHDPASDRGRIAIVRAMAGPLAKARNQVLTDIYLRKTAMRLGVGAEAIRQEFRRQGRRSERPERSSDEEDMLAANEAEEASRPDTLELWFLRVFLRHDGLIEWFAHHLNPDWLQHHLARELFWARTSHHDGSIAEFLSTLPHEGARSLVSEILAEERSIPSAEQQAADIVLRLRNRSLDQQLNRLKMQSTTTELTDAQQVDLLQQMEVLRLAKRRALEPLPEV